jgi:protein-tyrosine kinase
VGRVEEALKRAGQDGSGAPGPAEEAAATTFPAEGPGAELAPEPPLWESEAPEPPADEGNDAPPPALLETQSAASRLLGNDQMLAISREQYRRLAASLHRMQAERGIKVILIASALAAEGKTLTASNLSLTLSESYGRDVLLIDADLRRPSLARTFGIPASPGLSDGLEGRLTGRIAPQRVSDRLMILPAGSAMPDPMAGLTSKWMKQLVAEARDAFDWVIIDTPPIGLMTDANLLSAVADGVVLVVKASSTPYPLVKRAVEAIGPERVLGTVLNRATQKGQGDKYYDYHRYAQTPGVTLKR